MSAGAWKQLDDRLLQKAFSFDLRVQRLRSPDGAYEDDFFYLAAKDWVNIIPITTEGEVVLVDQYRHGISARTLETPGGMIDSKDSDPEATAVRELEEETGYLPREVVSLGSLRPNPSLMDNTCHFFLATGCERRGRQGLEPSEDITVSLAPLPTIPELIRRGEISHMLVASAFFLLWTQCPELVRS